MTKTEHLSALLGEVTERLRALLNKRGVEWWETVVYIGATITSEGIERHYLVSTLWASPLFGKVEATDMGDGVLHMACLNGCDLTPEQAVEVTLGRGGCEFCKDGKFDRQTVMISNHGWQRINFCPNCGRKVVDE